jgi:hypothetical protein
MNICLYCQKETNNKKFCTISCQMRHRNLQLVVQNREAYYNSPKQCNRCKEILVYEKRNNQFCSKTCARIGNKNSSKGEVVDQKRSCISCGELFWCKRWSPAIFCSNNCAAENRRKKNNERFSGGLITNRQTLRVHIARVVGYKCFICETSNWNNKPITLQVDHIDGNAGNNLPENLRLLCPNCHSQTEYFSGRNKGNGRKIRGLPLN